MQPPDDGAHAVDVYAVMMMLMMMMLLMLMLIKMMLMMLMTDIRVMLRLKALTTPRPPSLFSPGISASLSVA